MTNPSLLRNIDTRPPMTQSVFPYRDNYMAPVRKNQRPVTRVDAPAGSFTGTAAVVADAAIRHAANAFQSHLNSIDTDMLSPEGVAAQIAGFQSTDAMGAAADAVKQVNDESAAADQTVADFRRSLADNDGELATQLAAQAYWNRKVRLLDSIDSGPALMSAAQGLIADASNAELGTLATELPDYLTSRNAADTSWINDAMAARVPELSDAIGDASAKAKAAAVTNWNYAQLTNRVNGTTTPVGYRGPTFCTQPS